MKGIKFIITGILFGIVMTKSEALSWYRIQEMFRFQSFHMYGIIGTAIVIGMIAVALIKKFRLHNNTGSEIVFTPKEKSTWRYLLGGAIFGLGWAMTGACPGPLFVNLGYGYISVLVVIFSALLGTFIYGLIRKQLPH